MTETWLMGGQHSWVFPGASNKAPCWLGLHQGAHHSRQRADPCRPRPSFAHRQPCRSPVVFSAVSHTHAHTHVRHPPTHSDCLGPSIRAFLSKVETFHPNPNKPDSIKPRNLLLQEGSQHCALLPEAVRSRGSLCPAEVGLQSPVDPDRTGLHRDLAPLTRHTEKPGSLCFFLLTEERNRKENHVEILGTKQTQKETVSLSGEPVFQQAPFQAAPESL